MNEKAEQIISKCCNLWGVSKEELLSDSRDKRVSFCKAMAAHYLIRKTKMTYTEVAGVLNRKRVMVYHWEKVYDNEMSYNKEYQRINKLMERSLSVNEESLREKVKRIINELIYGKC